MSDSQKNLSESEISLLHFFRFMRHTSIYFLVGIVLGGAGLGLISTLITPKYEAETLIRYRTEIDSVGSAGQSGALGSIIALTGQGRFANNDERDKALAILGSRAFILTFINDNDLKAQMYGDLWNAKDNSWNVEGRAEAPTEFEVYDYFTEKILSIDDDTARNLITITITWTDPSVARDWNTALVSSFNRHLRILASVSSEKSISFLREQITSTSIGEVRETLASLLKREIERSMLANIFEDYAFEIIDPAMALDVNDYTFPNHILFAALGALLGFLVAAFITLWRRLSSEMAALEPNE